MGKIYVSYILLNLIFLAYYHFNIAINKKMLMKVHCGNSVILATQEAEPRRMTVRGQPEQKVSKATHLNQ
jgi:hypothetical protein